MKVMAALLDSLRHYFGAAAGANTSAWSSVLDAAAVHGVVPLFERSIAQRPAFDVPAEVRERAAQCARASALHSLRYTAELLDIMRLFEVHGIAAVPYKGPVLSALCYGDPGLRSFMDLDLLLPSSQVFRARDVLIAHGFTSGLSVPLAREPALLALRNEFPLYRTDDILVELQWSVVPDYFSASIDYQRMYARANTLRLGGRQVPTLAPEDLILVLCIHGSKHRWSRLRWIADVAAFLRTCGQRVDWDDVEQAARRSGTLRMVSLGLHLAEQVLSVRGTAGAAFHADPAVVALGEHVRDAWANDISASGVLDEALFHIRLRERVRDRLRYGWKFAVSPTVEDWTALPGVAGIPGAYHLIRPFRLASKHFGTKRRAGT